MHADGNALLPDPKDGLAVALNRLIDQLVEAPGPSALPIFKVDMHAGVDLAEDQEDHVAIFINALQEQLQIFLRACKAPFFDQVMGRGLRYVVHQEGEAVGKGHDMAVADGVYDAGIEQVGPDDHQRVEQHQRGVLEYHVPEGEID